MMLLWFAELALDCDAIPQVRVARIYPREVAIRVEVCELYGVVSCTTVCVWH